MLSHRKLSLIAATAGAAAALGLATTVGVASAHADAEAYVAIAYSPSAQGGGYAVETTPQQAASVAMADCAQNANDCELAAEAENGCAAIAASQTSWHGGTGANQSSAQADALARNGGGQVIAVKCVS